MRDSRGVLMCYHYTVEKLEVRFVLLYAVTPCDEAVHTGCLFR